VVAALRPGFAALTGLLFAAHPVHTEAVSDKFRDIPRKNESILPNINLLSEIVVIHKRFNHLLSSNFICLSLATIQ